MARVRSRAELILGIGLLVVLQLMGGCSSSDSVADVSQQHIATGDDAHLQRATLHVTGMT